MAKRPADPPALTLACWAWLTAARARLQSRRAYLRRLVPRAEGRVAADRVAYLANELRVLNIAEDACLEAARAGDPWRVWDRYVARSHAEVAAPNAAHELALLGGRSPAHAKKGGPGAENPVRRDFIALLLRTIDRAVSDGRDLSRDELRTAVFVLASLDGDTDALTTPEGRDRLSLEVLSIYRDVTADRDGSRAVNVTAKLLDMTASRVRQIVE